MQIMWDNGGTLELIEFDATETENHQLTATATERSVERGASTADHVRPGRDRLSVQAHVSNAPVRLLDVDEGAVRQATLTLPAVRRLSSGASGSSPAEYEEVQLEQAVNVLQLDNPVDRVWAIYTQLKDFKDTGQELQVSTSLRLYDQMVVEKVGLPRSAMEGGLFEIEFVQIRFAETDLVDPLPIPERAIPSEDAGSQEGEEGSETESRSVLASVADGSLFEGLGF